MIKECRLQHLHSRLKQYIYNTRDPLLSHPYTHTAHRHLTGIFFLQVECDKAGTDWNKKQNVPKKSELCRMSAPSDIHLTSLPPCTQNPHGLSSVASQAVRNAEAPDLPGWSWWRWSHLLGREYRSLRPHNWQK